jgi:hypothetical protein
MGSIVPLPITPRFRSNERLWRSTRIPLRRRLRAVYRSLAKLLGQIIASQGHDRSAREDFMQAAAREARERAEAIEASVGAMSAADIQRVTSRTDRH